ncbi:MAG: LysR family transcriptional regulator [Syntrophaceae bacterium]
MNIHQIRIFFLAAQTLSITQTAKKLHLSQPSVSIQIKDLEDALNVRLFDRVSRRIALTEAGKVLNEYAGRILRLIDETQAVMSEFSSGDMGKIVIGAPNTIGVYILPRYLGEFKDAYPKVEIALLTLNRQEAIEQVLASEVDFAFIQEPPRHADLESDLFMRDELVFICSPKHPWAKLEHLTPQMIKHALGPMIIREEGSGTRDIVDMMSKKFGVTPRVAMELSSTEGIKGAVEANLGIAVLSRNVVKREVMDHRLVALTIAGMDCHRDFYIVRNKKRTFISLLGKFYEFMLERRQLSNPGRG